MRQSELAMPNGQRDPVAGRSRRKSAANRRDNRIGRTHRPFPRQIWRAGALHAPTAHASMDSSSLVDATLTAGSAVSVLLAQSAHTEARPACRRQQVAAGQANGAAVRQLYADMRNSSAGVRRRGLAVVTPRQYGSR